MEVVKSSKIKTQTCLKLQNTEHLKKVHAPCSVNRVDDDQDDKTSHIWSETNLLPSEADLKPLTKTAIDGWCQGMNIFTPYILQHIQHFKSSWNRSLKLRTMSIFMQNILESFFPQKGKKIQEYFINKASPECLISPINVLHRSNQNVHQTLTATLVLVGKLQVGCCLDLIHQTQMFAIRLCRTLFHQVFVFVRSARRSRSWDYTGELGWLDSGPDLRPGLRPDIWSGQSCNST